jgi:aminoglycoside 3-N-acetyltransferase
MHTVHGLTAQLRELGLRPGDLVLVHTSLRAVGRVEEGPVGLIRALENAIGPSGTLVMPTMTDGTSVFDPARTPSVGMGITAETFWRLPGVVRSTHPGGSFAAKGPLAERICAPQPLEPPHGPESPPGRVYELGGQVLLLGVHHSESTVLHVAESLANVPYGIAYPCVVVENGVVVEKLIREMDHCCMGFRQVEEWIEVRQGRVGDADARLASARELVDAAVARMRREPTVFLCATDSGCEECALARASMSQVASGGSVSSH